MVTNSRASDNQPRPEKPPETEIVDVAFAAAASAGQNPGTANPSPPAGTAGPEDSAGTAGIVDPVDTGVMASLQSLVLESDAIQDFLDKLAHYAADRLSTPQQAMMCGVTLVRDRTHTTVASSNDLARAMDEVQYSFGDGPCLDAARHQHTNHVPDILDITDENARWPEYRAVVAGHGLRSILSVPVPLDVKGTSGCAINMYAETAHAFSANDVGTAEGLAAEAGDAVRIAVRIAHFSDTSAHLRAAMESRTAIDLAAGIVMAQNRCSQATAVTILKAASSARNLKLHDLAATLISSITADTTTTHFNP